MTSAEGDDRPGVSPGEDEGHEDVEGGTGPRSVLVGPSDPASEALATPQAPEVPEALQTPETRSGPETFIGPRGPRWRVESVFVRIVATSGIVGISVALAAILGTQDVAYWITGLVVALVSVILAAVLWSSRTL